MRRAWLPVTERRNPRTARLDRLSTQELLRVMNKEDARVPAAVRRQLPQIARAADAMLEALRRGGRVFYVGAGTSGRMGVLDATEVPPTFGLPPGKFQALLAGGRRALVRSAEAVEDSARAGARDLRRKRVSAKDLVVGLTASGSTPYVLGALEEARRRRAFTIAVSSNPRSPVTRRVRISICPQTGPEVVAGSTRLKAGTAQKLVLNMLSTAACVRLGHVYRNLMVNVQMSNRKLRRRGQRVLELALGCSPARSGELVRRSGGNLKAAIVMGKLDCPRAEALRRLRHAQGHVARALENE